MSVTRIGITLRVVDAANYRESRDALAQDWTRWSRCTFPDAVLLMIPNDPESAQRWFDALEPDAIILSNGNDLGERRERDETEFAITRYALRKGVPLLGVCRGLQVLNVFHGGTVLDNLGGRPGLGNHVAVNHPITLVGELPRLLGCPRTMEVNSYHDQGVVEGGVANELEVFARTEDGVVEGIFHRERAVLAIQWHPERENPAHSFDTELLERFLTEGAFWA